MSKILLVGDIHFKDRKLAEVAEAWDRTVDMACRENVDFILHPGDVFHHANVFGKDATVGTIYDAFLAPMRSRPGRPNFFVIPGNHDIAGPEDKDALAPLEGQSWVTVKRKPGVYPIVEGEDGGVAVAIVPWISRAVLFAKLIAGGSSPEESKEKIEAGIKSIFKVVAKQTAEYKEKGYLVIFLAHMEVTGAVLDSGETQAGGAFEFSPKGLAAIGADAYALGHIHKRQRIPGLPGKNDGYLGSLCQTNFGEQSNKPAVRLLEIGSDWTIESDKWIENTHSPRYFTAIDELDGLEWRENIDYVKLRADEKPANLPPGVLFEKKPNLTIRKKEDEDKDGVSAMDAESSLDDLLSAWKEASGCEVDIKDLLAGAATITTPPSVASVGSLDRINRIALRNVTTHKDTNMDLSDTDGVIAVQGPNGAGKTTALEAPLVAWYGTSPNRSLATLIPTSGGKDGSFIEVEFSSQGKEFIARREFAAKKKAKGYLTEKGKKKPIAGPGMKETTKECASRVGDMDLVLAGIFSSQGDAGSLLDLDPSNRKELFAGLMGTDKFLPMSEDAKSKSKGRLDKAEAHEARAETLRKDLESDDADDESLEKLKVEEQKAGALLAKKRFDLDKVATKLKGMQRDNARREPLIERLEDLKQTRSETHTAGVEAKAELAKLKESSPESAEEDLAKARAAAQELEEIKTQHAALKTQRAGKMAEASEKREQASSIRESRSKAYSVALEEAKKKSEEIRANRSKKKDEIDGKMQAIRDELSSAKTEEKMMTKKVGLLEGFPDEEVCRECPLSKDGIEARDGIEEKEKQVKALESRIEKGTDKLEEFAKKTNQMVDEASFVAAEKDFQPEEITRASALDNEADEIETAAEEMVPPPGMKEKANELRSLAETVPTLEEKARQARDTEIEAARLETQLQEMRDKHKGLGEEIKKLEKDIPEEKDVNPLLEETSNKTKEIEDLNQENNERAKEIGRQESIVEQNRKKKEEMEQESALAKTEKGNGKVFSELTRAFGRDGIPQMLVENTLPRFQDIMNKLLVDLDGGWSIRVSSQKASKKGTVKETIDIPVDDGDGERDIGTYSGGEKKMLKYVVRIAFAALQSERHGKGLKVHVLDEPVDALDDDRAGLFVEMVGKLTTYFNQIFVISHNARILSTIPMKIKFDKTTDKVSTVSVLASRT
jgi:DNA repair exonuclease SbcCD ATPase subunit/DNA repair exonuclease SbcCD nuclease subunit